MARPVHQLCASVRGRRGLVPTHDRSPSPIISVQILERSPVKRGCDIVDASESVTGSVSTALKDLIRMKGKSAGDPKLSRVGPRKLTSISPLIGHAP